MSVGSRRGDPLYDLARADPEVGKGWLLSRIPTAENGASRVNNHSLRVYDSILGLAATLDNPTPLVRLARVIPFEHTQV